MGRTPQRERELLVDAFTKVAAERGYAKTTAGGVAAAAGLTRSAFYAEFSDKRQCLLAAYDHFFASLIEEIEEAMDLEAPWPQQVETGVAAALSFVIEQVDAARLFAVEAPAVGPPAVDRYQAAIQRIAGLLRYGRAHSAEAAALPALTEPVLAAGAVSLVTSMLLAEDQAGLPRLESELLEVLLLPYAEAGGARSVTA
jgi:AcrR family transcriptional regulator